MEKPIDIYSGIVSKIKEIDIDIIIKPNLNKEISDNIRQSSKNIGGILKKLEDEINQLENQAEWKHYTISFIGETNAGKSTIIEALRIKYNEEEKRNDHERNSTLLEEEKNLLEELKQKENQFLFEKDEIDQIKNKEIAFYLKKIDDLEKTFLFKIRKLLQKSYEPHKFKISELQSEIYINSTKNFEDLGFVDNSRKKIKEIKFQIKYDGEIIGDGRLDFTQKNKSFFIKIDDELVKIIDVPGIEGNEEKYEEEIKKAVSESHCVFYVTSSSKTLESGTLGKVKKYIKDQADVFAIVNLRLNQYKYEFFDLSFGEIYKNKLEPIASISNQLIEELKDNFIEAIAINGHWGFLSFSKFLNKEKLLNDKEKLDKIFVNETIIFEKSNFISLENVISKTLNHKEGKIYRTNVLKINSLLINLISNLKENSERYLSEIFLNDITEQSKLAKKELNSSWKDLSRDLDNTRARVLNEFRNKSYKKINDFVERSNIDENSYTKAIEDIINLETSLLQKSISSDLKENNEKVNKQIEKSLSKFLNRLETLSKINNVSFNETKFDVKFDFFKEDLLKFGMGALTVGGFAMSGATFGAIFGTAIPIPVIGTVSGVVVGAVVGAIVGIFIQIFNFLQSTTTKKSKILSKISDQLNLQVEIIDKQLKVSFSSFSDDVKRNLIDEGVFLVEELVEIYKQRKTKVGEVIKELEDLKIKL